MTKKKGRRGLTRLLLAGEDAAGGAPDLEVLVGIGLVAQTDRVRVRFHAQIIGVIDPTGGGIQPI
jgi:hypothetical protein